MKSVLIATPAYQYITPETRLTIQNLMRHTKTLKIPHAPYEMYNQSSISHARNDIVRSFLRTDHDYLFFIDADVYIKNEKDFSALDRLASRQKMCVSGLYVCKNPPFVPAVLSFERLEKGDFYERWNEYPNPKEVYANVTGFTLIKRELLEELGDTCYNLEHPDNTNPLNPNATLNFNSKVQLSEDYSFCQKVRQAGGKLWVDHSFELFHLGSYGYNLMDFYYTVEGHFKVKPGEKLPETRVKIG